jgi:hypothetical protein
MPEILASAVDREHPIDAGLLGIAAVLPRGDLLAQRRLVGDPPVEVLADHHADLDHPKPARVLGREVKLEAAEDPTCFGGIERLVEGCGGMRRQIVEHRADPFGIRVVLVDEIPHAFREVDTGSVVGDLGVSPGPVDVDEHEDVGGSVAHVLVVDMRS